ncbi:hypothetical protein KI387_009210, partial [Taxus chinensis]
INGAMNLRKGDLVEVCSDEEGFKGAWYAATIVRKAGAGFLVEFKDLVADDEKSKLREKVEADQLRPQPPSLNRQHFTLHEKVDAYDRDGWWAGTIDTVLPDNNYIVDFSQPKEKLAYNVSQLRLHLDWVDDKWLQPSENPILPPDCSENTENITPKPERRSSRANKWKRETKDCGLSTESKADCIHASLQNAWSELHEQFGKRRQVTKDQMDDASPASRIMNTLGRDVEGVKKFPPSKEKQKVHFSASQYEKVYPVKHAMGMKGEAYGALDSLSTPEKNMIRTFPYFVGTGKTNGYPGSTCETATKATLKEMEVLAYHSVLKALYLRGAHTWNIEILLADLRQVLHISNEEAASELRHITY